MTIFCRDTVISFAAAQVVNNDVKKTRSLVVNFGAYLQIYYFFPKFPKISIVMALQWHCI